MKKIKKVFQYYLLQEAGLFRYSLSYCLLLSLLPTLMILLLLFKEALIDPQYMLNSLYAFIPRSLFEPFIQFVMSKNDKDLVSLIVSMAIAFYVASRCFYTFMIKSANDEQFPYHFILVRVKSVIAYFVFMIGVVGLFFVSQYVLNKIWYLALLILILLLYLFYRVLTFKKKPLSYGLLGAIISGFFIIVVSQGFTVFIEQYTRYDTLYGPLVNLVVLLFAIYLIASIVYFGYCVNRVYGKDDDCQEFKRHQIYCLLDGYIEKILGFIKKR